jgi:putative membrane protein
MGHEGNIDITTMDGGMSAMHDGAMTTMGGGMMLIWSLVGIALVALLVVGVLWLTARIRPGAAPPEGGDRPALVELERRYARGEVDRETFLTMRADLLERR